MSRVEHAIVAILDQQAAGDHRNRLPAARRVGQAAGQQQAKVLLAGEGGDCGFIGVGRDHDLGEDVADRLGGRAVERAG